MYGCLHTYTGTCTVPWLLVTLQAGRRAVPCWSGTNFPLAHVQQTPCPM
jgi:hypothetical protein